MTEMEDKSGMRNQKGFTVIELMVTVSILVVVLIGLIQLFIYCSRLSDIASKMTMAMSEAQSKIEQIKRHDYDNVVTDYSSGGTPGNTFDLAQLTGKGVIYLEDQDDVGSEDGDDEGDLIEIKVVVCWQDEQGHIIGEDLNLNGVLDAGEDTNGNGELDSTTTTRSMISKR